MPRRKPIRQGHDGAKAAARTATRRRRATRAKEKAKRGRGSRVTMSGPESPDETEENKTALAMKGTGWECPVQAETMGESTDPLALITNGVTVCGANFKKLTHAGGEPVGLYAGTTKTGPRALYDDAVDEPCPP